MNTAVQHNYTGFGWEGEQYRATKDLPKTEIAKRIKAEVMAMFPSIKFSIRTSTYTGGSSITLKILDFGFDCFTEQYKAYLQSDMSMIFEYWCRENFGPAVMYVPDASNIFKRIEKIANNYRYNDSDGQVDYFDTNFYFFVTC